MVRGAVFISGLLAALITGKCSHKFECMAVRTKSISHEKDIWPVTEASLQENRVGLICTVANMTRSTSVNTVRCVVNNTLSRPAGCRDESNMIKSTTT